MAHLLEPVRPKKRWIRELWTYLVSSELGIDTPEPPWLDLPAVGQLTASQPFLWLPFREKGVPCEEQVKPFNFVLVAFPRTGLEGADDVRPIAPYERDAVKNSALRDSGAERHVDRPSLFSPPMRLWLFALGH